MTAPVPVAKEITTNTTMSTDNETQSVVLQIRGVSKGQRLCIIGNGDVAVGVGSTKLSAKIREGTGVSGTVVGGVCEQTVLSQQPFQQLQVSGLPEANQDDPIYTLTFTQNGTGGDGTILHGNLLIIPVGVG